jgi:D-alanyl-D-alanine carboxypeptidase
MSGNDRTGQWGTNLTQNFPNLSVPFRAVLSLVSLLAVIPISLHTAGAGNLPLSAIVVDANSGSVLYTAGPDELRHPASLTKVMTLYLLFERMEAGKFKVDSQLPVSEHASVQAPSKLGLRPGQTIAVEDAIRAMVTKWPMTWPSSSPKRSAAAKANSPT